MSSWDEAFADRYEEWSAHMTADVAVLRRARARGGRAARRARDRERAGRDPGRAGDRPAGDRHRLVAGDARAGPGASGRGGRRARPARGRHARPRARRAGGADLLPVPRAAAPADLGRPPPHLRARRRLAPAGRPVRLERLRLRPPHRRAARRRRTRTSRVPHTVRYAVGDNRIDITLDDGATSSLWWATKNEWLGLHRRRRPRGRGALRRLRRRAVRPTTAASTSSSPAVDFRGLPLGRNLAVVVSP